MSTAPNTFEGSCLCGAVRYQVSGTPDLFFLCHCSRCRKGTGSAHASNMFIPDGKLVWLSGEDVVTSFAVEGAQHARAFCSRCGSPVPMVRPGGRVKLPAGSLDTNAGMRPLAHIWTGSRADWDEHLEDVTAFDERPG